MSLIIVFVGVLAIFAIIGRISVPVHKRLPIRSWGVKDIFGNYVQGMFLCLRRFHMSSRFAGPRTRSTVQGIHVLVRIRRILLSADTDGNHGRLR